MDWKSIVSGSRLKVTPKPLLNYEVPTLAIVRSSMMLQIGIDHFIGDVPGAPTFIADPPEVTSTIAFLQLRELLLKLSQAPALELLYEPANTQAWPVPDMHVNMILGYCTFEYLNILGITDLHQKCTAAHHGIPFENMKTAFRAPHYVNRQS